jgi:limonene-1,2-epoxide hydrolase
MEETQNIIEKFYEAFCELDAERMVEYYHDEVTFEDPAFGVLKGEDAKNMWRMLCESQQGKNFEVMTSAIEASEKTGKATWEAYYTFGKQQRKVHNIIMAHFEFKEGKIINHIDRFNLYKWSKQAMGTTGFLVGWTAFFRRKLQKKTRLRLSEFSKRRALH